MTELSFLLELLLNHKLPKVTREAVTARVKDVEAQLYVRSIAADIHSRQMPPSHIGPSAVPPHLVGQSPSTVAAMMRHEQNGAPQPIVTAPVVPVPPVVAVTAAAQAALQDRNAAINQAISGKPEKGRTSPRKF